MVEDWFLENIYYIKEVKPKKSQIVKKSRIYADDIEIKTIYILFNCNNRINI